METTVTDDNGVSRFLYQVVSAKATLYVDRLDRFQSFSHRFQIVFSSNFLHRLYIILLYAPADLGTVFLPF